jgi:hypothetical protein
MHRSTPAARVSGRFRLTLLAALVAASSLVSCSSRDVASFNWKSGDGARLGFSQTAGFEKGKENLLSAASPANAFILAKQDRLEPGFMIAVEVEVERDGLALSLSLSPGTRESGPESRFAAQPGRTVFYLSPPDGGAVRRLRVSVAPLSGKFSDPKDGAALVKLKSVAARPAFRGFERLPDGFRVSDGISAERGESGATRWIIERPFPAAPKAASLVLRYAERSDANLIVEAGEKILVRCASARKETVLPAAALSGGGGLSSLAITVPAGVQADALFAEALPEEASSRVDPGVLLLEPPLAEGQDYLWYRWDLLPDVIVFDFRDYAVQDAYLKRLAFYVEKKGFAGRLAPDGEIASLHGWNAHDYKTEDLARFYSLAARSGFPLNDRELKLRDFLVAQGLLAKRGGEFAARHGAIISITRESPTYLRHTFLTHESSHAIYFADAAYRDYCAALWNSMPREEKWYWLLYFGWMNYDVSSVDLMANELQAYLVQQPPKSAGEYFRTTLPERVMEHHPELKEPYAAYMARFGDEFERKARMIDAWLRAKYGFGAGTTFFVR